jgi:TetR/AcrR family transcriptional regulator, copper-responsive repressor
MGRPRKFSREGVLQKALPVFWKYGFARTTLPDLEQATGVNKSGLYAEFDSKEALSRNPQRQQAADGGAARLGQYRTVSRRSAEL